MKRHVLLLLWVVCISNSGITQTVISGIINTYTPVSSVNYSSKTITVGSSAGYNIGDKVLIIQMQGAQIDESQSSTFGSITSFNDAGNYEIQTICNVAGNDITFQSNLQNTYTPAGKVQLVSVPVYDDAIISGTDLTAAPWNGTTGGVLILEVNGTLDFGTQNINVTGLGFAGASAITSGNGCSFLSDDTYYSSLTDADETASKGEGIALVITGKECGRGPQANGGGGGNNHNGGGSGGGNFGAGGAGGQRIKSSAFTCGSEIGIESKNLVTAFSTNKIFLGGGGGAGHGNNSGTAGESGLNGGGIVIIKANQINGNNQSIIADGSSASVNADNEGGGGGGAGGTVLLDVITISSSTNISVNGGNGASVGNVGTSNCSGPGGGGGGGLIWFSSGSTPAQASPSFTGGTAGVITSTSQANCTIGDSNGGQNGQSGGILYNLQMPAPSAINSSTQSACDSYTVPSGDETYFISGIYTDTLTDIHGCDSILTIDLTIVNSSANSIAINACDSYTVPSGDETYTVSGIYSDTLVNSMGCDSILTIDVTIAPLDLSVTVSGITLTSNATGSSYQWMDCSTMTLLNGETNQSYSPVSDGSYAVIVSQTGCSDTSQCISVTGTNIIENSFANPVLVYPNPFSNQLFIQFESVEPEINIILTDIHGKTVLNSDYFHSNEIILKPELADGLYILFISGQDEKAIFKIVKQ